MLRAIVFSVVFGAFLLYSPQQWAVFVREAYKPTASNFTVFVPVMHTPLLVTHAMHRDLAPVPPPKYPAPGIVYSDLNDRFIRLPDGTVQPVDPPISQGEEDEQNENFWWPDEGPYWPH